MSAHPCTLLACNAAPAGRRCTDSYVGRPGQSTERVRSVALRTAGWTHRGGLDFCPVHHDLAAMTVPPTEDL